VAHNKNEGTLKFNEPNDRSVMLQSHIHQKTITSVSLPRIRRKNLNPVDTMSVPLLRETPEIENARSHWRYRGGSRPAFATEPKQGQSSVWDFPRPPVIEDVPVTMTVRFKTQIIAETQRGRRVLETAGAPTYYFPPEDVFAPMTAEASRSVCEWKGLAESLSLPGAANAGWRYTDMFPAFQILHRWVAFYPAIVDCYLGEQRVSTQPGGYYGGWVSPDLVGPIKGEPGSSAW